MIDAIEKFWGLACIQLSINSISVSPWYFPCCDAVKVFFLLDQVVLYNTHSVQTKVEMFYFNTIEQLFLFVEQ